MSKEKSNINWDLIAKHLSGETDSREEALLAAWVSSSEANRRSFADLERWWQQVGRLALYSKIDVAMDWQKVKQQLKLYEPARRMVAPRRNIFRRYMFSRAAAAVVAALVIAGAVYYGVDSRKQAPPETVAFTQIYVPVGQQSQVELADGTSVWLNSGSTLQFPANFDDDCRVVKLDGEALFDVTHNENVPFVVNTDKQTITVLGTTFNVMDYSADDYAFTTLVSGSVKLQMVSETGEPEKEFILKENQQAFYDKTTSEVAITNVKIDPTRTRMTKVYRFHDKPLFEIMQYIEKFYGVKIYIVDEDLKKVEYTGTIYTDQTIEEILTILNFDKQFSYTIENDTITIKLKKPNGIVTTERLKCFQFNCAAIVPELHDLVIKNRQRYDKFV